MGTDIISAIAAIITALGLVYAGREFHLSRQLAKHQFLLQFYQLMDDHNDLHIRVTDGNKVNDDEWPTTRKDWVEVGRLLGLYEYMDTLVKDKIISINSIDQAYSYRLVPVLKNPKILKYINESNGGWIKLKNLIRLLESQTVYKNLSSGKLAHPDS